MVLRYWLGPGRMMALLSRKPSTMSRTFCPVSPRKKGEPLA